MGSCGQVRSNARLQVNNEQKHHSSRFSFKLHTLIVQIRDVETDCALGPHQVGELVVQGPQVMLVMTYYEFQCHEF